MHIRRDSAAQARFSHAVKQRDNNTCRICHRTEAELMADETMDAHHILPKRYGGSDEVENGETRCSTCHRTFHGGEE